MRAKPRMVVAGIAVVVLGLAGSATPVAADVNANYVRQVYLDLLQTPPDPMTLDNWVLYLDGAGSRNLFVTSVEATNPYLDLLIDQAFNHLLHRPPLSTDFAAYQTFLGGTGTVEQMQSMLLGSPEYYSNRAGSTTDGFIDAMYQDVLNRVPSPSELHSWENIITSGGARSDVALVNLSSGEYRQDFVGGAFNQFLRRPATITDLAGYVTAMNSGATDQQVVADLLSTDEYFNLAQVPEPSASATIAILMGAAVLRRRPKNG